MCPLNLLHFLRGGPQAASQVRGHLAPDSAESGPAGGSSGSPPSHSPQVRGQGTPRGKSLSQHPQPPWAVAALTFPKVLQPPFGERGFLLGYGERGDTRCAVTRSPGVLPAFPSQSRDAQGCSYLVPRRSAAERASGALAAGDPGSQRHWIPQAPPDL